MGEIKKLTFMEVMKKTAEKRGDAPALKAKVDGEWKTTSWKDYYAQVRTAARAFMKLGLKPGGGVTIVGKNCPQWLIGNNGAIFAGGVATGIYITSTPPNSAGTWPGTAGPSSPSWKTRSSLPSSRRSATSCLT